MLKLGINCLGEELLASAEFARREKIGLEVTDFAFPEHLTGDLSSNIERHRRAVQGVAFLSFHGPFLDLIATSRDPDIIEVSRRRHECSLKVAESICAQTYIAHTNYNPLIRNLPYRKGFVRRTLDFWLPFADQAAKKGTVICLENLWEDTPDLQTEIVIKANHPGLKASLDNGHALIYSKVPARKWIATLGRGLAHCHLHDNFGVQDEHAVIGEGKESWPELLEALKTFAPEAAVIIECDDLKKNQRSMERLTELLI